MVFSFQDGCYVGGGICCSGVHLLLIFSLHLLPGLVYHHQHNIHPNSYRFLVTDHSFFDHVIDQGFGEIAGEAFGGRRIE